MSLLKAVSAGRSRQVRLLLDLGASLEEQDDCGQTPLIRAVLVEHERNRDKILRTLLKRGALVSKADVVGRNALMWACLYGRDHDVALLIDHADVDMDFNMADINGQTALFHAVSSGNAATVKLVVAALVKYGLSTDTPDSRGFTPLMHAMRLGHDICESILIYEGNAKVGLTDFEKNNKKDKWAISSLRDRSKVKISQNKTKQSQFPPIEGQNRRVGNRFKNSDTDSSLSSDDDSFKNDPSSGHYLATSENNIYSSTISGMNTPMIKTFQNVPPCKIPPSAIASITGSSIGNAGSSDNESEVDSVASTIVEGRSIKKVAPPPADIVAIFGMKQEQMSTSFRQTAVKVDDPVIEERCDTPKSKGKGRKDSEARKWMQLKRNLRLTGLKKSQSPSNSSLGANQSPGSNTTTPGGLPNIFSHRKSLLLAKIKTDSPQIAKNPPTSRSETENKNYSEI